MTRFIARHPLLVGTLLTLPHMAWFWHFGSHTEWRGNRGYSPGPSISQQLLYGNLLWFAAVAFAITLARRRHGFSAAPVFGLMPMLLLQTLIYAVFVESIGFMGVTHLVWGLDDWIADWTTWFCEPSICGHYVVFGGGLLIPVGLLFGLMLANVLANHKVRSGRWQVTPDRDPVVRPGVSGIFANIGGIGKGRRVGSPSSWLRLVTLAAMHPHGVAAACLVLHLAITFLAASLLEATWGPYPASTFARARLAIAHFAAVVLLSSVIAAMVTVFRSRAGLPLRSLAWLPLAAAYQCFIQTCLVTMLCGDALVSSFGAAATMFVDVFGVPLDDFLYLGTMRHVSSLYLVTGAVAALSSLAGIVVGMLIARHKRRSGRWETIVPVPPGGHLP